MEVWSQGTTCSLIPPTLFLSSQQSWHKLGSHAPTDWNHLLDWGIHALKRRTTINIVAKLALQSAFTVFGGKETLGFTRIFPTQQHLFLPLPSLMFTVGWLVSLSQIPSMPKLYLICNKWRWGRLLYFHCPSLRSYSCPSQMLWSVRTIPLVLQSCG